MIWIKIKLNHVKLGTQIIGLLNSGACSRKPSHPPMAFMSGGDQKAKWDAGNGKEKKYEGEGGHKKNLRFGIIDVESQKTKSVIWRFILCHDKIFCQI